jgi:predicted cupin superfamily sugar epimerase
MTAAEVIALLGLVAHPEGGWYRETWRDDPPGGRGPGSAIYFLLDAHERSAWHRVDATEIWHHHLGAPIALRIAAPDGTVTEPVLGPDLLAGHRPQVVVPADAWQSASPRGGWALVGCTVSPAFTFTGFELAPPGWEP